jgi:hypothetical protein
VSIDLSILSKFSANRHNYNIKDSLTMQVNDIDAIPTGFVPMAEGLGTSYNPRIPPSIPNHNNDRVQW